MRSMMNLISKIYLSAFVCLLLIIPQQLDAFNGLSPEVSAVVDKIALENILKGKAVGYNGEMPEQYRSYQRLKAIATTEELLDLTNHSNGVVRCYSFWALVERNYGKIFSFLLAHLRDNDEIKTMFGCGIFRTKVSDFYIEISKEILTKKQMEKLNDYLLFEKNISLSAKDELLRFIMPLNKNYSRLKEIAETEQNALAVIALARFHKEEDIKYISSLFYSKDNQYYALTAIREFPHPKLFPLLKKLHEQEIIKPTGFDYPKIRMMYKAIVQYKNQESVVLLKKTISSATKTAKEYHASDIWLALEMYPDKIYNDFKKELKLTTYQKSHAEDLKKIKE